MTKSTNRKLQEGAKLSTHQISQNTPWCIKLYHHKGKWRLTRSGKCMAFKYSKKNGQKNTNTQRRRLTLSSRPTNPLTFDLHLVLVSGPNHPDLVVTLSPAAAAFRLPRGWGSDHLPPLPYSALDSRQSPAGTVAAPGCVTGAAEEEPRVVYVYAREHACCGG